MSWLTKTDTFFLRSVHKVAPNSPKTPVSIVLVDSRSIAKAGNWIVSSKGLPVLKQAAEDAGAVTVRSEMVPGSLADADASWRGQAPKPTANRQATHAPLSIETKSGFQPSLALGAALGVASEFEASARTLQTPAYLPALNGVHGIASTSKDQTWSAADGRIRLLPGDVYPAVSTISAASLLDKDRNALRQLKGSVVLIIRSNDASVGSNAWAQGQAAAQLINNDLAERPYWAPLAEASAVLLIGLGILWLLGIGRMVLATIALLLAAISLVGAAIGAYLSMGLLFNPLPPIALLAAGYLIGATVFSLRLSLVKAWLARRMGAEPPTALVRSVTLSPAAEALTTQTRDISVLSLRIRDTAKLTQAYKENPAHFREIISKVITMASDVASAHGATLMRPAGDQLIAYWNAPIEHPQHAHRACDCALAILGRMEPINESFSKTFNELGIAFEPVQIALGVESGPALVCESGKGLSAGYSAYGEPVERALQLSERAPLYGPSILVGKANYIQTHKHFALLELDRVGQPDGQKYRTVYALMGNPVLRVNPRFKALQEGLGTFLKIYRQGDFSLAAQLLEHCAKLPGLNPKLVTLYTDRLMYLQENNPGPGWNGRIDPPIR